LQITLFVCVRAVEMGTAVSYALILQIIPSVCVEIDAAEPKKYS